MRLILSKEDISEESFYMILNMLGLSKDDAEKVKSLTIFIDRFPHMKENKERFIRRVGFRHLKRHRNKEAYH
jgi:hypothetical protein